MLGKEGTEQFEIHIDYNGRKFHAQKLHDPFIRTRIGVSRWDLFKALFYKQFQVNIRMEGTSMVQRHIMMLDPEAMAIEEKAWLEEMRLSRENSPNIGYYVESKA